eukprot:SAG22_NODE_4634_length_1210_cov_2.037804_1_plen_122_part_10
MQAHAMKKPGTTVVYHPASPSPAMKKYLGKTAEIVKVSATKCQLRFEDSSEPGGYYTTAGCYAPLTCVTPVPEDASSGGGGDGNAFDMGSLKDDLPDDDGDGNAFDMGSLKNNLPGDSGGGG